MLQWSKNNFIFLKNKSLSILIVMFSLLCLNISASELIVHENGFSAAHRLGVLKVLKDKNDYFILTNSGVNKVHKHDISPSLRKMNDDQLIQFLNGGNGVIKVGRFTNGEFKLDRHVRGNGGGALGAAIGVIFGKAAVSGIGHGTIYLIASLTGPAAPVVAGALEGTFGPSIEAASIHAAAVCGLAGAALTGPI